MVKVLHGNLCKVFLLWKLKILVNRKRLKNAGDYFHAVLH